MKYLITLILGLSLISCVDKPQETAETTPDTPEQKPITAEEQVLLNNKLIEASKAGPTEAVKELLDKGANVNAKDKEGISALMWASTRQGNIKTVKLLIDRGANVNAKSDNGTTVLMFAEKYGYTETVNLLKQRGAKEDKGITQKIKDGFWGK